MKLRRKWILQTTWEGFLRRKELRSSLCSSSGASTQLKRIDYRVIKKDSILEGSVCWRNVMHSWIVLGLLTGFISTAYSANTTGRNAYSHILYIFFRGGILLTWGTHRFAVKNCKCFGAYFSVFIWVNKNLT